MENGLENSRVEAGKLLGCCCTGYVQCYCKEVGRKGQSSVFKEGTADMSPTLGCNVSAKVRVPMRVRFIKKRDFQGLKKNYKK